MNIKRIKTTSTLLTKVCLLIVFLFLILAKPISSLDVDFYDTYSGQGSNEFDKISWVDTFPPTYFTVLGVFGAVNTPLCYCVNEDRNVDSVYEFCICKNSTSRTACSGVTPVFPVLDTTGSSSWFGADVVDIFIDVGSGGNSFYETSKTVKRGQISYFCDVGSGCQSCGSTADSSSYNYYFIDKTFNVCDSDGSVGYSIRGYYSTTAHILVDSPSCSTNLVCDTDHDGQISTTATSNPSSPCKIGLDAPLGCGSSSECWNNEVCSGARFDYGALCDGDAVDIVINEYDNNCGGDGVLVTIDSSDQNNDCSVDAGYPSGYVCDSTLDNTFQSSLSLAYDEVCKGGVGNSCTLSSDCVYYLSCNSGFCGYSMNAVFTDNITDFKLYKGGSVSFDNSLSSSSDDNIKYACWIIDGVKVECDGDNAECTTYCNGASYDSFNSFNGFTHSFNSGGNYDVNVTMGSGSLYSGSFTENYCISGDGNYCFACNDGLLNDDEVNVDWGGRCGFPYFVKCNNGILDNVTNETMIDYGGVCGNCENTGLETDMKLSFLKSSKLLIYPFTIDQCGLVEDVQGGVIMFILIASLLLIIPLFLIILGLIFFIGFFGLGGLSVGLNLLKSQVVKVKSKVFKK